MKYLFLTFLLYLSIQHTQAQKAVKFSGQIENMSSEEPIYLILNNALRPLELADDGTFSTDISIQQNPSFFYFANISPRGKVEKQTPLIWFENDIVKVKIDWSDKSFQMEHPISLQSISEKIEALEGKKQVEFILNNPNNTASLYFANKYKEKTPIEDLEKLSQVVSEDYKQSIYFKRLESYVSAKKRGPLKIGNKMQDFTLPDKDGQYVSVANESKKAQLIALFSSDCSFSVASIQLLEQFAALNGNKMELITIWEDPYKENFINDHADKKKKITWTNLWDEYGFAATYLNREMWPTFYVINKEGILSQIITGYDQKTAKQLRKLLE